MNKAFILIGLLVITFGCMQHDTRRLSKVDRAEAYSNSFDILEKLIGDYFWWHGTLPTSVKDVADGISKFPPEWQPPVDAKISLSSISIDKKLGVAKYSVSITDDFGYANSRELEARVSRFPDEYRPHYTYLQKGRFGKLAATDENLAISVAWAYCDIVFTEHKKPSKMSELYATSIGGSLKSLATGRRIRFKPIDGFLVVYVDSKSYKYKIMPPSM